MLVQVRWLSVTSTADNSPPASGLCLCAGVCEEVGVLAEVLDVAGKAGDAQTAAAFCADPPRPAARL
jgi:hypothetical protein